MRGEDSSAGVEAFLGDERAIEGLPIRLVIAVVVGVAALGIMLTLLDGFDDTGTTEVTVELSDELVSEGESVTVAVVTEDGQPVEDAQLLVTGGSLPLSNGPITLDTGPDSHEATLSVGSGRADARVAFRNGQTRGTLDIEVVPPSGSGYADQRANADLVVVDG
jgi:hypothetical protein